jgi:hypothetical protein
MTTIRTNLSRLRRRERLLALAWGGACWLAVVLAALVLACFVDWLIDCNRDTPWAVRYLLFGVQVVLAAGAGYYFILRPLLRRLRDDELALWVEEKHPLFAHRLITAVQLGRSDARIEGMSRELILIVTKEAEQGSRALAFETVADHTRLKRAATLLGPVLLVALLLFAVWPALVSALVARQFLADVEVPRRVHLEPLRTEYVHPAGEKIALQFRVTAEDLNPDWLGHVYVTPQGQPRDRYVLQFSRMDEGAAIFEAEVAPSTLDLSYTARLEDGRLRSPARVKMVPRPIVSEQLAWLQLPAFCGTKPDGGRYEQPQGRGDVVGIPGSSARIAIRIHKPVRRAYLELLALRHPDKSPGEEGAFDEVRSREVELTLDADGMAAEGTFDLRPAEIAYRIVVIDEHGFENVPAPRRSVRVVPEEPPQVTLLKEQMPPAGPIPPGASWEDFEIDGLPVVPGKKLRIGYLAQGPYGLGRARLLYRIVPKMESGNEPETELPWRSLELPEIQAGAQSGAFDPKLGAFEHSRFSEAIYFHAVPSPDPERILGRTLGGGRFDFETKGISDGMGGLLELRAGDQFEFCIEVFADKDPKSTRPSARSDVRTRPIITGEEFARWFADALQEERRLKDLDSKQRGVFELR